MKEINHTFLCIDVSAIKFVLYYTAFDFDEKFIPHIVKHKNKKVKKCKNNDYLLKE